MSIITGRQLLIYVRGWLADAFGASWMDVGAVVGLHYLLEGDEYSLLA